jgi:hypothetical protein
MTEQARWQIGLIVFHALKKALAIRGVDQHEVHKAFAMAAATLAEPQMMTRPVSFRRRARDGYREHDRTRRRHHGHRYCGDGFSST